MHSLQILLLGPSNSLKTSFSYLPQKLHRSMGVFSLFVAMKSCTAFLPTRFFCPRKVGKRPQTVSLYNLCSTLTFQPISLKKGLSKNSPYLNGISYLISFADSITLSTKPYSAASYADKKLSRSVSRSISSKVLPVLWLRIAFKFLRILIILSA